MTYTTMLIGPMPDLSTGKIGGARISYDLLTQYYLDHQKPVVIINTQPWNSGLKKWLNPFSVLYRVLRHIHHVQVVFANVSQKGIRFLVPILYALTRLFGKKMVFRPFGGSLKEEFARYGHLQRWLFRKTALRADLVLLQTKELYTFFAKDGRSTRWYPTSRKDPPDTWIKKPDDYQRRFIFLGHVKQSKGVDLIIRLATELGPDYTFHIYGPIKEKKYASPEVHRGTYKGLLPKERVLEKMSAYDVLLLPTFFYGEGYPGAIIEAYSLGLPVITTSWKSIPEIVRADVTGKLIEPKSYEALKTAVLSLDTPGYASMSRNARTWFKEAFDSTLVNASLYQDIRHLVFG